MAGSVSIQTGMRVSVLIFCAVTVMAGLVRVTVMAMAACNTRAATSTEGPARE